MNAALPWHVATLARLEALIDDGVLPNAMALTCPPGWGHENLLANAALRMLGIREDKQIDEFAHPDFRWIRPEGAVIKIDQVRRLNHFAVQTPQAAPRKVAALLDAHLLNSNAANALLKTLEEPPPDTHLLLGTPYWSKLLPTIRSRCQRFKVRPDSEIARRWLAEKELAVSDVQFAEYGYAPLAAYDRLQAGQMDLTAWLMALPVTGLAAAVEQALEGDVVAWLSQWYRRVLLHLAGEAIPQCGLTARSLFGFSDELLSIRRQIESSNAANARSLLEQLIVRWMQVQRRAVG